MKTWDQPATTAGFPGAQMLMKITILTYLERETSKEHDVVVDQVAKALKAGGHRPSILGVHGDVSGSS